MSLNNISFSSQLIADLYRHTLVGDTASAVPQPVKPTPAAKAAPVEMAEQVKAPTPFLGKNGKQILIIVDKPNIPFLPDGELEFLAKILTACQLSLADVAIVNWHRLPQPDAEALAAEFQARAIILFAIAPALFGLSPTTPMYTVQGLGNRQFAVAPALGEIEKSREAKQQLWMALKQLFNV
jgi:hypothetical protein